MTRDEAKQLLIRSITKRELSEVNIENWLNGLEVKFSMIDAVRYCRGEYIENTEFIKGLEKFGYKIVTM